MTVIRQPVSAQMPSRRAAANVTATRPFWVVPSLLATITFLTFARSLTCGFLDFDDDTGAVTAVPLVKAGLTASGFRWAWANLSAGYYVPLHWLSLMVDAQVWGIRPAGYHLTNVLLHIGTTIFLYLFLHLTTGSSWRSALVALLFAVHPLRVESVVWVAERKDVLSLFFGMMALLAYLRYTRRPGFGTYGLFLLMTAASLLAKPTLITLPALLLIVDFWPLKRIPFGREGASIATPWRRLIAEKIPVLLMGAIAAMLTFVGEKKVGALAHEQKAPLLERLATVCISSIVYLKKTLLWTNLAILYPRPPSYPAIATAGAAALLMLLTIVTIRRAKRAPWQFAGWSWYLVAVSPVSGIVQFGPFAYADRFTYVPSIGLLIALIYSIPERWTRSMVARAAAALVALLLAFSTFVQIGFWKDSVTLFSHTLAVTGPNPLIEVNLGRVLSLRNEVEPAEAMLRLTIRHAPRWAYAHTNLANVLRQKHDPAGAWAEDQTAIELDPHDAKARVGLADGLAEQGQREAAIEQYRLAVADDPKDSVAYFNLANTLADLRRGPEAIPQYQRALRIDPDFADAHVNLGIALAGEGQHAEAIEEYSKALAIHPADPDALDAMGESLIAVKKPEAAIEVFERALRLRPSDPVATQGIAKARGGLTPALPATP